MLMMKPLFDKYSFTSCSLYFFFTIVNSCRVIFSLFKNLEYRFEKFIRIADKKSVLKKKHN